MTGRKSLSFPAKDRLSDWALKNIPALGRATQGVRIMRLNDGDEVVSLALVDKVEEDEYEEEEVSDCRIKIC